MSQNFEIEAEVDGECTVEVRITSQIVSEEAVRLLLSGGDITYQQDDTQWHAIYDGQGNAVAEYRCTDSDVTIIPVEEEAQP